MFSNELLTQNNSFLFGLKIDEYLISINEKKIENPKSVLIELVNVKGKRNVQNTLRKFDEILVLLDAVSSQSSLLENVHPNEKMRTDCEKLTQKATLFSTELSLNKNVYDALQSIDQNNLDDATKFYLEKTLRSFKLAGVDKDLETRNKVKSIIEELVLISQEFSRNIREDVRKVEIDNPDDLKGLPEDFINSHKPDSSGKIILTINYPDAVPVFSYAENENLRKKMYMEYNNRAYPKNIEVLDKLIAKRYELAKVLGFKNYAELVTADKMVGSEINAANFIENIAAVSIEKSKSDYNILLDRKRKDSPNATEINPWESSYYSELVRRSSYNFDAQKVRPYFQYKKVKSGVLEVASKLFNVNFKENKNVPVWDKSVECWEMFENGQLTGRFYLDMHPRKNKYNNAAHFCVRNGVLNKQIPEAALVCNFPGGEKNDLGLMEHGDVVTFFHEFGHLIHHLFAGKQKWIGQSGISTEWDFVEVPSQILEEWAWDAKTLQTFAHHYETGEPIPAEIVKQMKNASEYEKGLQVRQQMYLAKLSLSYYDRPSSEINTNELVKYLNEKYTPYKNVEGTHMQTSFGHLDDYSAIYYTYMWSLVIAKDLFTKFDKDNLLDSKIALKYKDDILVPGGSLPANNLVKNFLGRDFNFNGWKNWFEK